LDGVLDHSEQGLADVDLLDLVGAALVQPGLELDVAVSDLNVDDYAHVLLPSTNRRRVAVVNSAFGVKLPQPFRVALQLQVQEVQVAFRRALR
jgi:hypothetical protein